MEIEKIIEDSLKYVDNKMEKFISKVEIESLKMDLKSQIYKYEKNVKELYERLGELYYFNKVENLDIKEEKTIIELISANKKIIYLLREKLYNLEK